MAKKSTREEFFTYISREGAAGAVRGKISGSMAKSMGAEDGDIIRWEIVNGTCVGGEVMSRKEADRYKRETGVGQRSAPAKSKKPAVKEKSGSGKIKVKSGTGKIKAKADKRKTSVSYDKPKKSKSGKVKPKFRVHK